MTTHEVIIPGCAFLVKSALGPATAHEWKARIEEETRRHWERQMTLSHGWPARVDEHYLARFGDVGIGYQYKGKQKPVHPWTPTLRLAAALVSSLLDCWRPNCVVVNWYGPTGSLYPHRDSKQIPQLGPSPTIASLSMGAMRTFRFHPLDERERRVGDPIDVPLMSGDVLVMRGDADLRYHHSIPPEPEASGDRLSLTFRRHLT